MPCRHYIVEGRVQGVFFRASTKDNADSIGVKGWVRNMPDGRVEAMACGTEQQLAVFETCLSQGPPMAVVSELKIAAAEAVENFIEFSIR